MKKTKINNLGKGVIEYEIKALYGLKKSINDNFFIIVKTVKL